MVFSNRDLSFTYVGQLKATDGMFWESFDNLDQQIIKGLLMLSVRDSVRWSLTLEGTLSAQMRKGGWNCIWIFIQITMCIIGVFLVIWCLVTFPDILTIVFLLPTSSACTSFSLHQEFLSPFTWLDDFCFTIPLSTVLQTPFPINSLILPS